MDEVSACIGSSVRTRRVDRPAHAAEGGGRFGDIRVRATLSATCEEFSEAESFTICDNPARGGPGVQRGKGYIVRTWSKRPNVPSLASSLPVATLTMFP